MNFPKLYFRARDNGANVYRVEKNGKFGRLEYVRIATAVLKSGKISPNGDVVLSDEEVSLIEAWIEEQRSNNLKLLAEDLRRMSRDINLLTNHISANPKLSGELDIEIEQLLFSLTDMQRVITEKFVIKEYQKTAI